jgi:predicted CXXCH cytochrome family protein
MSRRVALTLLAAGLLAVAPASQSGLKDSVHNLTATGPGTVKAPAASQLCVFCHAPHNPSPSRALWNRELPATAYQLYDSSTLEATLNQPTGASRVCLSCHDGTLALGNLRTPPRSGRVSLGPLRGRASLGTDLSDDHPVSFVYDSALALRRGELTHPTGVTGELPVDGTGQLQCTTCHDPHDNPYRKFLRVDDRSGALCTACHRPRHWRGSTHASSPASWRRSGGKSPWPHSPYTNVADNACGNCHRPHAAAHPPRLLSRDREPDVCLVCHDGSVTEHDLDKEFTKISAHRIDASDWIHEPREDPDFMPDHVTCVDCHNPHESSSSPAAAPSVSGRLQGVSGVNQGGSAVRRANYEYEICFKCHGLRNETTQGIARDDNTRNVRLELSPSSRSYHPVTEVGRNPGVRGFTPGYSSTSMIYCTDCHNNDEWTPAGGRPRGAHGSRYQPLLEKEYRTDDPMSESYQSYALCYKCHDRSFLINDQANAFPHGQHVRDEQTSCAVCHDAHGARDNESLINFMRYDESGKSVVDASGSGRLEFVSLGPGRGQCFLQCHGSNHDPKEYP